MIQPAVPPTVPSQLSCSLPQFQPVLRTSSDDDIYLVNSICELVLDAHLDYNTVQFVGIGVLWC